MVMTQTALMFLGVFATGTGYLGLFANFTGDDRWTRVLLLFASAFIWGWFGLSSNDVIVRPEVAGSAAEPIVQLVYFGYAMAFMMALFAFMELLQAVASQASDASTGLLS